MTDIFYVPSALAISSENLKLMWQTPLLGMLMVFAVLALLWGVLAIFKLVFAGKMPKADKEKKPAPVKKQQEAAKEEAPAVTVTTQKAEQSDAELCAVITAAVAAYMAEDNTEYVGGFRVVSFKRVRGGRAWNNK